MVMLGSCILCPDFRRYPHFIYDGLYMLCWGHAYSNLKAKLSTVDRIFDCENLACNQ